MANHTKKQGEIKTWNEGKPNIVGGSGALGLIGGVAGKAVKMLNFANIRSAVKQYVGKGKKITTPGTRKNLTNLVTKPSKNVTPTGADPRSRIYGEHVSPKGEALGSYQYRSTGFGGGGRVWEPTKKSVGKMQKNLDAPSGYYRSDAKGWPLPISSGKMERKRRVLENIRLMKK